MNKRGGIIGFLFFMGAFWVVWIFFISPFINTIVDNAIATGSITGMELFVLSNINYIIGLASLALFFLVMRGGE